MSPVRLPRLVLRGLLAAAVASTAARSLHAKPPVVGVACAPGIPGCTQLDFVFDAPEPLELVKLSLTIDGTSLWRFEPVAPGGSVGVYEAEDAFGPFGGPTTIDVAGVELRIDFLGSGLPFTLGASGVGLVRVAVENRIGSEVPDIDVEYAASDASGATYSGTAVPIVPGVVPEPAPAALLAAGLGALGLTIRRAQRAPVRTNGAQ